MKTLTRTAVDLSLRTALAPWSTVARWTRTDQERTSPLEVAVGRVDASIREIAGRVTRDDELLEDAMRRRAAADNREVALNLREQAEQRELEAEQRRQEREEQAEAVRQRAEEAAEQKRKAAEQKAAQRKQSVKKSASSRKQAVRKTTAAKRETIAKAEREARLEELREKEQALDAQEKALSEQERATRLQRSAEQTKAAR